MSPSIPGYYLVTYPDGRTGIRYRTADQPVSPANTAHRERQALHRSPAEVVGVSRPPRAARRSRGYTAAQRPGDELVPRVYRRVRPGTRPGRNVPFEYPNRFTARVARIDERRAARRTA